MSKRRALALAVASVACIAAGVASLVLLMRRDAAQRAPIRLASGETVSVEYEPDDPHAFASDERESIAETAARAFPEVRRALPVLPPFLILRVRSAPSDSVIPETGDTAYASPPNVVTWQVDASRPEGVAAIARAQLRSALFHELHHDARGPLSFDVDIRARVITEGLATAFERDFGGYAPPWGVYPPEVEAWTREVFALPPDAPRDVWLRRHPDGRRWIGLRVGTFIVDCAMKASGKTSADLVRVAGDEIIAMCPATR